VTFGGVVLSVELVSACFDVFELIRTHAKSREDEQEGKAGEKEGQDRVSNWFNSKIHVSWEVCWSGSI
jgi:hypothetical protein